MEFTGRFTGLGMDLTTGLQTLSVSINQDATGTYQELRDCELSIVIKKRRKKRSLDANAYYWVLVSQIADIMRSSKEEIHNIMLSRYGQIDRDEAGNAIMFSLMEKIDISKRYDLHAKPIGTGTVDGKQFVHYALLKGSHLYDTVEMSILIDGAVSEAKDLGIETLTPDELQRMKEAYHEKKNQGITV